MIAYMNPLQGAQLEAVVACEPVLGARIHSWYRCYGNAYPFCDFWLLYADEQRAQGDEKVIPLGAVCRYQGTATVVCRPETDFSELGTFLSLVGALEVEAMEPVMERLLPHLPHVSLRRSQVMAATDEALASLPDRFDVRTAVNYADVHAVLCAGFEGFADYAPFNSWYVDTSAHVRRSDCLVVSVDEDGTAVATAGVYYLGPQTGMISDVATHPAHRGRGLGGRCVQACMLHLKKLGRRPTLVLAEPALEHFYRPLGFEHYGVRCSARLDPLAE